MNLFNIFKTKRILERDGYFYPQKKSVFGWKFLDKEDGYLWTVEEWGLKHSACYSMEEAAKVLEKDFTKKSETPPSIYHYV